MSRKPKSPPSASWRDIQQGNKRKKTTTKVARQRRLVILFRAALGILLLAAIGTGILGIRYFYSVAEERLEQKAPMKAELVFKTDGVLSEDWFMARYGDVLQTEVRQIEVSTLKAELEKAGQVTTASVTVSLPSRLIVGIQEREPIMRLRISGGDGKPKVLLLARDGTLYEGSGYPSDTLRRLPGAAGLKVRRLAEGYAPIEGIDGVARLLDHAKESLPAVYRHWRIVDLSDWDPELDYRPSLVRIRSAHIEEIIFSTTAIEEQVERLAGILEHTQRYQMGQPRFIDLSYGEEAVIRYN